MSFKPHIHFTREICIFSDISLMLVAQAPRRIAHADLHGLQHLYFSKIHVCIASRAVKLYPSLGRGMVDFNPSHHANQPLKAPPKGRFAPQMHPFLNICEILPLPWDLKVTPPKFESPSLSRGLWKVCSLSRGFGNYEYVYAQTNSNDILCLVSKIKLARGTETLKWVKSHEIKNP